MNAMDRAVSILGAASRTGCYLGDPFSRYQREYLATCSMSVPVGANFMGAMFTRDDHGGNLPWAEPWMVTSGLHRCLHLSLSFVNPVGAFLRFDRRMGSRMASRIFGNDVNSTWVEKSMTDEGKVRDVHHYRLFCAADWTPEEPPADGCAALRLMGWLPFREFHAEELPS